eukprot:scaffold452105_cov24-Prasinocladus_malaysianus.AAC.1
MESKSLLQQSSVWHIEETLNRPLLSLGMLPPAHWPVSLGRCCWSSALRSGPYNNTSDIGLFIGKSSPADFTP